MVDKEAGGETAVAFVKHTTYNDHKDDAGWGAKVCARAGSVCWCPVAILHQRCVAMPRERFAIIVQQSCDAMPQQRDRKKHAAIPQLM